MGQHTVLHDDDAAALVAATAFPADVMTVPANCAKVRVSVTPVTGGTFIIRRNGKDSLMEKGAALVDGSGYVWDWPVEKGDTIQVKSSTTTAAQLLIQAILGA